MFTPKSAALAGPIGLLLVLALLPFAIKAGVMALALTGYGWQSAYKLAQLAAPVFWRRVFQDKRGLAMFWPIDERLPSASTWGLAVLVAVVLEGTAIAAILLLAPQLGIEPNSLRAGLDAKFAMTPVRAALVVVYLLSFNAALEELHFRAWLDRTLSARFGNATGISASAVLFAAMHMFIFIGMPGVTPLAMILVFFSLILSAVSWSWLARRPGGIHAAWFSHGLTDAILLTWGLFWLGYF